MRLNWVGMIAASGQGWMLMPSKNGSTETPAIDEAVHDVFDADLDGQRHEQEER